MNFLMYTSIEKFKKIMNILVYFWLLVFNLFCIAVNQKERGIFYVLMWTNTVEGISYYVARGRKTLILMNCIFQNCYFTDNKDYFSDLKDYDAILFNAPYIHNNMYMPTKRSDKQIYVFVSAESESNFYIPEKFNDFFNYTFTYKLNSDIPLPYFYVRNKFNGKVIAPKANVHWKIHKTMKPTPKSVIEHLQNKSICAAWFVSSCSANNGRLHYVHELRLELQKLGQELDIFGGCGGNKNCPRHKIDDCFEILKQNYFFYLAFENSFSEDYVTEKLMTAVNSYAVPVVYGGANYTRFLPDGAYINSRLHAPRELANMMNGIIMNRQDYYDYFKFYRYYTYHTLGESEDIDPACNFCKFLNSDSVKNEPSIYHLFSQWWHNNSLMHKIKASVPVPVPNDKPDVSGSSFDEFYVGVPNLPKLDDFPAESGDSNVVNDVISYYFKSSK